MCIKMHNQQQDALGVIQLMLGGILHYHITGSSDLVGGGLNSVSITDVSSISFKHVSQVLYR
jgi:hypothetical protein